MTSIIIPYYNPDGSAYVNDLLERAVKSAVGQFGKPSEYEIIIVDDGSPIPPRDIAGLAGNDNIRLIENRHTDQGTARNTGLDAASGDIVAFLDADDYYYPGMLGKCVDYMKSSGADLLSFKFAKTSDGGVFIAKRHESISFSKPSTGCGYMSRHIPFGCCWQFLISRSLLTAVNLRFPARTYAEDEEFVTKLLFYSRKYIISDAIAYAYCTRDGSTTSLAQYDNRANGAFDAIKNLHQFACSLPTGNSTCIGRKISSLATDLIRLTLRRPDWKVNMPIQTERLRALGLWPLLPLRDNKKQTLFALLSRNKAGMWLLHINEKRYENSTLG